MATTTKNQLANGTTTQQNLYNQALLRQAQLNNQAKYFEMAQKDPWFAFGNMLGNALVGAYNNRGISKEKEAIDTALADYQNSTPNYTAMNNLVSDPSVVNSAYANIPTSGNSVGTQGLDYATPTVGDNTTYVPNGANGVSVNNVPATSNLENFKLDDFKAKYYKDAQARNRPQEQIDQAWADKLPELEALAKQAKDARINTAMSALTPNDKGQYSFGTMSMQNPQYLDYVRKVMDDNPELATMLVNSGTKADEERVANNKLAATFAQQRALQEGTQQFQANQNAVNNNLKLAMLDKEIAAKIIAALIGADKVNNKNALTGGISHELYTDACKMLANLEQIENGDMGVGGKPLTPQQTRQKAWAQNVIKLYTGGNVGNTGTTQTKQGNKNVTIAKLPNPNIYDDGKGNSPLLTEIDNAIKILSSNDPNKGVNDIKADILREFAKQYNGDTGYVEKILNEVPWAEYGVRGA